MPRNNFSIFRGITVFTNFTYHCFFRTIGDYRYILYHRTVRRPGVNSILGDRTVYLCLHPCSKPPHFFISKLYISLRVVSLYSSRVVGHLAQYVWVIPRPGASSNYGKTLFRLIEILRMYFDTSLKTSREDCSAISSPRPLSRNGNFLFFGK